MADVPLPEPSFRLLWKHGEYKVTRQNIDDCDCYTADQMHAHAAAVSAAKDERIKVLEDALASLRSAVKSRGLVSTVKALALADKALATRAALGDKP